MKKFALISLILLAGALLTACFSEATETEYNDMCENLVRLRGKVDSTPLDEIISKIEKEYQLRATMLKDQLNREIMAWDELFKEDISGAKDTNEKERLQSEDEEFRANAKRKYEEQIEELTPKKQRELRRAKERVEESQMDWSEAVDQCVNTSQKEKVSQKTAHCRMSAVSTDIYWNSCR